ncbi:hypothetical protein [Comamonas sp. NoAH]|uniref:hypothetical protein n=1 Tax=Comamonas halotolerans TaxID=3041496 RepID=UPI0024E08273|nr:hypothetical protein [Comamonas sp. NoAH]
MNAQEQLEQEAAFEASFAGKELPASEAPATATPASAAASAEQLQPEEHAEQETATTPGAQQEQPAAPAEEDPEVFDGFKRSEVLRLFEQASKVSDLELQLRKANGRIGDLLRKKAEAPAQSQVPPQSAAPVPANPELEQFAKDFPEIAQYVQAVIPQASKPKEAPQVEQQQTEARDAVPTPAALDPVDIELAVMDRMHKGWRQTVQSQEFNLWLGAQPHEVQQEFEVADTADRLAAVIGQYSQWSTARAEAANKAAKGKQRLQAAVTPTSQAQRPTAELTEEEAFEAAFNSK